jgi:hypothetical protein
MVFKSISSSFLSAMSRVFLATVAISFSTTVIVMDVDADADVSDASDASDMVALHDFL